MPRAGQVRVGEGERLTDRAALGVLTATFTRSLVDEVIEITGARSAGRSGSICSPGPVSTYALPSSHTCHAGQARSPGTSIHSSPDFLPASERRAFRSVTP